MISFWQVRVRNGERRSRSRNRSGADFRRFSLWCSLLWSANCVTVVPMLDRFLMALTAASTVGDDGGGGGNRQGMVAIAGCAAMAVLYVGSLYVPSVVLRLPPPRSINAHYLRRFLWSIVASALAAVACLSLLPVSTNTLSLFFVL